MPRLPAPHLSKYFLVRANIYLSISHTSSVRIFAISHHQLLGPQLILDTACSWYWENLHLRSWGLVELAWPEASVWVLCPVFWLLLGARPGSLCVCHAHPWAGSLESLRVSEKAWLFMEKLSVSPNQANRDHDSAGCCPGTPTPPHTELLPARLRALHLHSEEGMLPTGPGRRPDPVFGRGWVGSA